MKGGTFEVNKVWRMTYVKVRVLPMGTRLERPEQGLLSGGVSQTETVNPCGEIGGRVELTWTYGAGTSKYRRKETLDLG